MKAKVVPNLILVVGILSLFTTICYSLNTIDIHASASGWVQNSGPTNGRDPDTTNFIAGTVEDNEYQYSNYFVFDLSDVESGVIISATLYLQNPVDGFYSVRNENYTYSVTKLGAAGSGLDASDLLAENWSYPYTGIAAWSIINNGHPTSYGDVEVNAVFNGNTVEVPLNALAISDLNSLKNSSAENYYALGGRLINSTSSEAHIFANTGYNLYSRILALVIGTYCPGDFDEDGDVDGSDLAELLDNPEVIAVADFPADFGNINCYE